MGAQLESPTGAFGGLCGDKMLMDDAEMMTAGKAIPIAEILKAHRTYDLYHEYKLYNIEFDNATLEEAFKNQLLCSCVVRLMLVRL